MCVYNKNLKKLKYLVKPHERFPYGSLFVVMTFFGENPICNTVDENFQIILGFLDILIVLFQIIITKDFQNVILQDLSVGFLWINCFHQENHLILSFNSSLLIFFTCDNCFVLVGHELLFDDRRTSALTQKRMKWLWLILFEIVCESRQKSTQ